jgi:hypothetical protein
MPLSDEAASRFAAYVAGTDPSNVDPRLDDELLAFVAWSLVKDPEALTETFSFEAAMSEFGFQPVKMAYVHTVIAAAQPLVEAYERERRAQRGTSPHEP